MTLSDIKVYSPTAYILTLILRFYFCAHVFRLGIKKDPNILGLERQP